MTRGIVGQLWLHPAKSMRGHPVEILEVGPVGVVGDRAWAVRDAGTGGIRSAKKLNRLREVEARFVRPPSADDPVPPVVLTLPDGTEVDSDDPEAAATLGAVLGADVVLSHVHPPTDLEHYRHREPAPEDLEGEMRGIFGRTPDEPLPDLTPFLHLLEYESPPGTYVDAYPVHLLTTASLDALAARNPDSVVDVRRFRPNIVVALDDAGASDAGEGEFPEQAWVGQRVRIGEVELDVVSACPRCVMVTQAVEDLPVDRSLLRSIVKDADQAVGVYANVVTPGRIRAGDPVEVLPAP